MGNGALRSRSKCSKHVSCSVRIKWVYLGGSIVVVSSGIYCPAALFSIRLQLNTLIGSTSHSLEGG